MPKLTIEAVRVNSGLTQAEMADKLGITRTYYCNMEKGKVPIKSVYVYSICQITGFGVDDIILPERTT